MKFKQINSKKIITIILSGFIIINLVGCSKNETTSKENNEQYEQEVVETNEIQIDPNEPNIDPVPKDEIESNDEPNIEINNNSNDNTISSNQIYSSADEQAIEAFNNLENNVDSILSSETINNVKAKAKGIFVSIVDFIFYDSEINGVTFDELTDSGKQKILEIAYSIDTKIENKFPNYKETISETAKNAFNKASELIKKGADNLKEFSKEQLGEENYNAIIEVKDEIVEYTKEAIDIIGDVGSDLLDSGKEYIKNWYENFRN